MRVVSDRQNKEAKAKHEKEKELSKVKINKDDVDYIVSCTTLMYGIHVYTWFSSLLTSTNT